MSRPPHETDRFRHLAAVVLLVVTGLFLLVALSQLFVGAGGDPRDSLGSRAAGFGFTDRAHNTLYGAIPLALPLAATWLAPRASIRLVATVLYSTLLAAGVLITGMAFGFGMDTAGQQRSMGAGVFIDNRFALEQLVLDASMLGLMGLAMFSVIRAHRRDRARAERLL